MHLDALVTYDDVITICSRGDVGLAKWWNGSDFGEERSRAQRNRSVALLVARYRHALMLGHGDRIAQQWWERGDECEHEWHWNARQRQRGFMRRLAARRLDRYALAEAEIRQDQLTFGAFRREDILSTDLPAKQTQERSTALRLYLCTLAQYEFERLTADFLRLSWRIRRAMRSSEELVTIRGLHGSHLWTVLRRAMAQAEMGLPVEYGRVWRRATAPRWVARLLKEWPVTEAQLRTSITAVIPQRGHAAWHEHYNVACVCAVALLPANAADTSTTALRKLAISHLYRAAAGSHSGYLAQRRSWLLYEDRDLASLRGTPEFRNFEMITFSPTRQVPIRPKRTLVWELVCYQSELISRVARQLRAEWFARGLTESPPDARPGPTAWYTMEAEAWRQIARLAVSDRDWRTRHDAADFLDEEFGLPAFTEVGLYSRYVNALGEEELRRQRDRAPSPIAAVERIAETYIDHCNKRLAALAKAVFELDHRGDVDACANAKGAMGGMRITRSALLRDLEHDVRSPRAVRRLCEERTALWGALADLFDDDLEDVVSDIRLARFRAALKGSGIIARLASRA